MVSLAAFSQMALSFPDVIEMPHFHLQSFRVKKKIFCTIHANDNRAMIKLPLAEQSVFCAYNNEIFFPVPGAWGKGGATFVNLKKVKKTVLKEAMQVSYDYIFPKKK